MCERRQLIYPLSQLNILPTIEWSLADDLSINGILFENTFIVCEGVWVSVCNCAYLYLDFALIYIFIRKIKLFICLCEIPHRINMGISFIPTDLLAFFDYSLILRGRMQSISNICNYIANGSERNWSCAVQCTAHSPHPRQCQLT